MANKEYIERLQMVIHQLHNCDTRHLESVPVKETFRGQTVWEGVVEVFSVTGHPVAERCFAWSGQQSKRGEKFTAVMGVPPVIDPLTAVRASIVADSKIKGFLEV